jgi:hypothetical protein
MMYPFRPKFRKSAWYKFDPTDQSIVDRYKGLWPWHWRWKWRIREAARTYWHTICGGYYPAVGRSEARLDAMKLTWYEWWAVQKVFVWMEDEVYNKERWW